MSILRTNLNVAIHTEQNSLLQLQKDIQTIHGHTDRHMNLTKFQQPPVRVWPRYNFGSTQMIWP